MNLEDLAGKHVLDAVDFDATKVKIWGDDYEHANVCNFRLDGVVYSAVEDPSDGYRSSMDKLIISGNSTMKNVFKEIEVVCKYRDQVNEPFYRCDDVLEIIDAKTGETILEVGTENTDDYYPCYVASFHPEAMIINK